MATVDEWSPVEDGNTHLDQYMLEDSISPSSPLNRYAKKIMAAVRRRFDAIDEQGCGHAETAARLETPRDIALTGHASGSVQFDGSGDVSISAAVTDASVTAAGGSAARLLSQRFADFVTVKDFGAKGDGVTDDSDAFIAALASADAVIVPYSSAGYYLNKTIAIPSNKHLLSVNGRCKLVSPKIPAIKFDETSGSSVCGFVLYGAHSSTTYTIQLANTSNNNILDIDLVECNSGISVDNSSYNIITTNMTNLLGTGIKFSGAGCVYNTVVRAEFVNVCKFGILFDNGASNNKIEFASKRLDKSIITDTIINSHVGVDDVSTTGDYYDKYHYESTGGCLGLECIGITIDCMSNVFGVVHAFNCGDNGVSITGKYNSFGSIVAKNNFGGGVHFFGERNSVGSAVCTGNRLSGVTFGKGETEATSRFNSIGSFVSYYNEQYGVRVNDDSHGNTMQGVSKSNTMGNIFASDFAYESSHPNTIIVNNELMSSEAILSVSDTKYPKIEFKRAEATNLGTEKDISSGKPLGNVVFSGRLNSKYIASAQIQSLSQGTLVDTDGAESLPACLAFSITPAGGTSMAEALRLWGDSNVSYLYPSSDVGCNLGKTSNRFNAIYAKTIGASSVPVTTINTTKLNIGSTSLNESELIALKALI